MQLSEMLGLPVHDAGNHIVGTVVDVRLTTSTDRAEPPEQPHLLGLVISPRTHSSYLGYERSNSDRPRVLAALLQWRHRGTFLADWDDLARIGPDAVTLRPGYTRYSPVLIASPPLRDGAAPESVRGND
jgi:hypothetical protein